MLSRELSLMSLSFKKRHDGRNVILPFKFDPRLQHWNECYRFSRPDKKYLPLGSIYAQEEVMVVNYDVVFTDASC